MASPLTIGTTATVVALVNKRRADIRFQNTSKNAIIYIKKIPITGGFTPVSETDYEVLLLAGKGTTPGEAFITNSVASFMAISDKTDGELAIYETIKI